MWCVRERGQRAVREPANIERLLRCDLNAKTEINERIASSPYKQGDCRVTKASVRDFCGEALASAGVKSSDHDQNGNTGTSGKG